MTDRVLFLFRVPMVKIKCGCANRVAALLACAAQQLDELHLPFKPPRLDEPVILFNCAYLLGLIGPDIGVSYLCVVPLVILHIACNATCGGLPITQTHLGDGFGPSTGRAAFGNFHK